MQPPEREERANGPTARLSTGSARGIRSLRRRKSAVSEIIGTILILSLTVVLFATIFYFISTLPPPAGQSNSQFTAVLGVSSGGTEAFVNVTYVAGPTLTVADTPIYLSSSAHPADYTCARAGLLGDPYTTTQGLVAYGSPTTWSAGQVWSLHLVLTSTVCGGAGTSLNAVNPPDNVTISILSVSHDVLLFHVSLPGTSPSLPPTFYDYGVQQAPPGGASEAYTIYTDISGSVAPGSVEATYSDVPAAPATPQVMTLNGNGQWVLTVAAGATTPAAGATYSFVVQATGTNGMHNSVVFYYTFPTGANSANLQITLSPGVGSPLVREADILTANIINTGFGSAGPEPNSPTPCVWLNWTSSSGFAGSITGAPGICMGPPGALGPDGTWTPTATWLAGPKGDGDYTITATTNYGTTATLGITVFPRTLVVDESGVAAGSNASTDTFTYLATALDAADVPYNSTVVPPGSSIIGWDCAAPTCLNNYDVVIWLLSNTGTLTASDAAVLVSATTGAGCSPACPGDRSVWLLGANAVSGASAALLSALGVTAGTARTLGSAASPTYPAITATGPNIPTNGIVGSNMYMNGWLSGQWSQPSYQTIIPNTGLAQTFLTAAGTGAIAVSNNQSGYKTMAMPFELSTLSMTLPWCTPPAIPACSYQPSLGQQTSIVYDTFNWLANFTMPTVPWHDVRVGNDWAVSEVDVQPATLAFNTPAWVNVTVRDNGPAVATTTAQLEVDSVPLYVGGSPVIASATPGSMGGIFHFSFNWTPSYIGFLSIGVCISPPSTDLDGANNCMDSNLFAEQLYVHYNVLLVDATLHSSNGALSDSTPYVYAALTASGFPTSTITNATIATTCGSLPAAALNALSSSPPHYNLVVWDLGDVTNATGCPLNDVNAATLEAFLNNGGGSSSLIMLGNGLLSDSGAHANGPVNSFLGTYLGIMPSSIAALPTPVGQDVYGAVNNPVGDGAQIVYGPAANNLTGAYGFTSLNWTPNLYKQVSMYYSDPDFWTLLNPSYGAATNSYSTAADWHTTYLGLNPDRLGEYGQAGALRMALLRAATFSGRLVPAPDAVVSDSGISFATATTPWTNFDLMHPQLEQQYLIDTNATNVGGGPAYSVGLQVFDGSHILATTSITVGPATASSSENVTEGAGQLSTSWTPLYASTQPIRVIITTSVETAKVLPNVGQSAQWNVTVYFFYDNGAAGQNSWTHTQLALAQEPQDPSCWPATSGTGIYYYEGKTNIPVEWPQAPNATNNGDTNDGDTASGSCTTVNSAGTIISNGYTSTGACGGGGCGSCNPFGTYWVVDDLFGQQDDYVCPGSWEMTPASKGGYSYQYGCNVITASYACESLGILDNAGQNDYDGAWTYSSPIYIAPGDTGYASWYQRYDLTFSDSGGTVCVAYAASRSALKTAPSGVTAGSPICNTPSGTSLVPSPGYPGSIPWGSCAAPVQAFTGSSAAGTFGWQLETVNLAQYAGDWISLAFNWFEGDITGCGSAPQFSGYGWWINDLNVYTSNTATVTNSASISEGTGTCNKQSNMAQGSGHYTWSYPEFIPNDLWSQIPNATLSGYAGYTAQIPKGTQGAWISAFPNGAGTTFELDPNMWDALTTRTIDLTSAASATLNFQYITNDENGAGLAGAEGAPALGLEVFITPVASNGQTQWLELYQAADGMASWTSSGSISLSAYLGEVVQIQFIAASNCNQDGNGYPITGGFGVADVQVTGTTIISARPVGPSPASEEALSALGAGSPGQVPVSSTPSSLSLPAMESVAVGSGSALRSAQGLPTPTMAGAAPSSHSGPSKRSRGAL
jgi:FlaG/FlaF family flagellin (archaellin)